MNIMNSSEISLRAAVFTAKRDLADGENFTDKIKSQALGQLQIAQKAEGLFKGVKESSTIQALAIGVAISGLHLAYQITSSSLKEAKSKRQRFVAECETHAASFVIDTSKEYNDFTKEEKAIREFYKIASEKCAEFIDYFGMNVHDNAETPHLQYYTVLPFYRMSQALEQNGVIATSVDHHRQAIFLFLKTGLPLQFYYQNFKNHTKIWLQLMGVFDASNYLNHFKAPRFMVTAIANLLWNLQHPVHMDTGIPLPLAESANICYKAGMFLNEILNPRPFPFLQMIDDSEQHLHTYLTTSELLLNSLRLAFEHERLHEINLQDVSRYFHTSLKLISNKILELIYHRENASEQLVGQLMIMGELLLQQHRLYAYFDLSKTDKGLFVPLYINQRPCTLIDIMVIFTHLSPQKRLAILYKISAAKQEPEEQLMQQLKTFEQSFLQPFEICMIIKLKLNKLSTRERYQTTASHFIPLLLLVMESFTIFKDTRPKKTAAISFELASDDTIYNLEGTSNDREQRQNILQNAASDEYYHFSLSCFLGKQAVAQSAMYSLLSYQNQIRLHTSKIDFYVAQIKENRAELLKAEFKQEVIDYLKKTIAFLTNLNEQFNSVEQNMLLSSRVHRDQKGILQPMFDELGKIIECIQKSIITVKSIMTSKDFDKNERVRIQERNQFRFIATHQMEGMSSRNPSMMLHRAIPEDPQTTTSIPIQVQVSYLHMMLSYTALLQLGLVAIFLAFNLYYQVILLSLAMNLSILLLGLGLPLIYILYDQWRSPHELEQPEIQKALYSY